MTALLSRAYRRGCRLVDSFLPPPIRRNGPCSTHEGAHIHDSLTHAQTGFPVLSSEFTSNVNAITSNKAFMRLSFKLSGYNTPILGNSIYVTQGLQKTAPKDGVSCESGVLATLDASKGWSHSKPFHNYELESLTYSKSEMNMFGDNLCKRRKSHSWTRWRSFSSLTDFQSLVSSSPMGQVGGEIDNVSAKDSEDFDFTNFPALTSSFFENYEPPSEMLVRRKRVVWQTKATSSAADKKLTVDSIPKPRGRTYDFGLETLEAKPPPLEAGARPQGGFDIDISFSEQEVDNCDNSELQRQSCLPSKITEFIKLSESQKDFQIIKDQNSQMTEDRDFQLTEENNFQCIEDRILDHEQDLLWDPYNDEQGLQLCKSSEFSI
ncbi:hypothetical protein L7F22_035186 [Adiantum nelumboides]|nr:hypothetical protein [Adiantum nelumboides]